MDMCDQLIQKTGASYGQCSAFKVGNMCNTLWAFPDFSGIVMVAAGVELSAALLAVNGMLNPIACSWIR